MRNLLYVFCVLLVSACDKSPKIEPVEFLMANPARLVELRRQCKADHAKVGDAQCNAVAEATRQRFMSGGTVRDAQPEPSVAPASAEQAGSAP
jgi:hypothetical protein